MDLTFSELKKREVINIVDGRSYGFITDIKLTFPSGVLIGIVVPGRKTNFFTSLFTKSNIYIDQSNIVRIGGDVILVNISCGDVCGDSVTLKKPISQTNCNPCSPCGNDCNSQNTDSFDL